MTLSKHAIRAKSFEQKAEKRENDWNHHRKSKGKVCRKKAHRPSKIKKKIEVRKAIEQWQASEDKAHWQEIIKPIAPDATQEIEGQVQKPWWLTLDRWAPKDGSPNGQNMLLLIIPKENQDPPHWESFASEVLREQKKDSELHQNAMALETIQVKASDMPSGLTGRVGHLNLLKNIYAAFNVLVGENRFNSKVNQRRQKRRLHQEMPECWTVYFGAWAKQFWHLGFSLNQTTLAFHKKKKAASYHPVNPYFSVNDSTLKVIIEKLQKMETTVIDYSSFLKHFKNENLDLVELEKIDREYLDPLRGAWLLKQEIKAHQKTVKTLEHEKSLSTEIIDASLDANAGVSGHHDQTSADEGEVVLVKGMTKKPHRI